jgi:hypothetical protein
MMVRVRADVEVANIQRRRNAVTKLTSGKLDPEKHRKPKHVTVRRFDKRVTIH